MAGRASQVVVQVLYTPSPAGRVSQVVVETAYTPSGTAARASQVVVEALYTEQQPLVGMQVIWLD